MNDFERQVYNTIKEMEEERCKNLVAPSHVLFRNLRDRMHCSEETLRSALNTLFSQGHIKVGSTLNDKYIHAI